MDFPRRVFDGEGVKADVDFGPTLMLNRNRCILCTRCVRFMRDVDGDAQINIIDRGYGSEIATFQEEGVHSLLSGNLMDVCPVGAITTRDYRFKSRPWDNPNAVDTICTLCSKGCNTTAWIKAKPEWAKGSRLIRITPRFNPDVNGYWMCDIGRFDYHWIEGDDRLRTAARCATRADAQQPVDVARRADASSSSGSPPPARSNPDGVRFLLSAHASHEELFLFRRLARRTARRSSEGRSAVSWRVPREAAAAEARSSRCRPSTRRTSTARGSSGSRRATSASRSARRTSSALRAAVEAGRVSALYVFDPGPTARSATRSWIVDARADAARCRCSSCRACC